VEGKQILDGIIVAHETIHYLKSSGQLGMIIKVDLAKSYDRINWNFLREILGAFGFNLAWISYISGMISSVFFSTLVNRAPWTTFKAYRGIFEGDPLSPYLFIILE